MAGGKKKATGFTQAEQELLAVSEKKNMKDFPQNLGSCSRGTFLPILPKLVILVIFFW